ncbi:unnamed protein product, partial [Lactuca virosa]
MFDLTIDGEVNDQHTHANIAKGVSKDYIDHGDQNVVCQICNAKLWTDESIRGKDKQNTSFSLCCGYGKVELPDSKEAPPTYLNIYRSTDSKSKYFINNIRRYNSMFSFTSMGGKVDASINNGKAPYIFRLGGQNYHRIGSLLPSNGSKPKLSQLYIYITDNEDRQQDASTSTSDSVDLQIIHDLKLMLDSNNVLVQSYRMVRDCFHDNPHIDLKLRLIGKRIQDGRTYNLLSASEVAALIVGDIDDSFQNRDIIVENSSGSLQRISELHPSYLALQYPVVVRLPFHLPGQQQGIYDPNDDIDNILDKLSIESLMFTSWLECNKIYKKSRDLTYVEFPTKFVWKTKSRKWKPREIGFSIGRIHDVSPKLGEAYFLRILLNNVRGPTSFEDIRTVNRGICPTFRDACYALGLLDDDREYIEDIKEASHSATGYYLRSLFSMMLISDSLGRPKFVWENTWEYLSDGILYNQRRRLKSPDLSLTDHQLKNLTLFEIESFLLRNNSTLKNFTDMHYPDFDCVSSSNNRLIAEELSYDMTSLQNEFQTLTVSLTNEQRGVFEDVMAAIEDNKG